MGYIKVWTEFETAATELYAKSPQRVRYCVKFKPRTGKLTLKITDDTTCILYKTFSSIILNRFELLNQRLLSQIANLPKPSIPTIIQPTATSATTGASLLAPPTGIHRAGTPLTGDEDDGMSGLSGGEGRAGTPAPDTPAAGAKGKTAGGGGGGGKKKKKGKR